MFKSLVFTITVVVTGISWGPISLDILQSSKPLLTPLALRHVTVIDMTNGQLVRDQTIVIVGNRIQRLGPATGTAVPSNARVIDLQGKYVIPGLWDMHAHVDNGVRQAYPLYIAHGVTGIREMEELYPFHAWQNAVMMGAKVGPRSVGASIDVSYNPNVSLKTVEDARRIVDSMKAGGYTHLKFHGVPDDRAIFFALLHEARNVGLPVIGHVPLSVNLIEAADSGMASIEHLGWYHPCFDVLFSIHALQPGNLHFSDNWRDSARYAAARCQPVTQALIRNGTWLDPTLVVMHYYQAPEEPGTPKDTGPIGQYDADQEALLRLLHEQGLTKILAGTDAPIFVPGMMQVPMFQDSIWEFRPGLSLLEELVLLRGAGLTPLEVLQTATFNPALFLHATDSLGTVAPGKLADLVLLDANPLADMHNVMRLHAVVANGRYFDRTALDSLDPDGLKLMRVKHYIQ